MNAWNSLCHSYQSIVDNIGKDDTRELSTGLQVLARARFLQLTCRIGCIFHELRAGIGSISSINLEGL